MNCPKCSGEFESIDYRNVVVERCKFCKGLWFDLLEKEDLLAIEGSESIDIGSDQIAEQYKDMQDVNCPKCAQEMIAMVDKDNFDIKYESCTTCYGAFFDAGEFRDLKENTVLDRFIRMLATLRS